MPHLVDGLVTTVDPTIDAAWSELVTVHSSDVFQSPSWLRAVSATYGFDARARILWRGASPVAGFAFVPTTGLNGERMVSFPFSDYCDPLASSFDQWQQLTRDLGPLPLTVRVLHNLIPRQDRHLRETGTAHWHAVDLEADDAWMSLAPSARRAIRKSRQAGVEVVRAESIDDLRSFYELHLVTRKQKYRMLAQPFAFFENLWKEFIEPGNGRLVLARLADRVVAGVLFLEWNDRLYYKFNASHPDFREARPNDAVMWAGIEYGRARGHHLLDLGLSDWGQEGLVRYKRKYASHEGTIFFLAHESRHQPTLLATVMPELTRLLTDARVPDDLTERAGRLLYRYFA